MSTALFAVVLFLSLLSLSSSLPVSSDGTATLTTRVPSGWTVSTPASSSLSHWFILSLTQLNLSQLALLHSRVSDPIHPSYQHYLTKPEIDAIVAPPASVVSSVTSWLSAAGVSASSIVSHGDALEVNTTVGVVNALFNTTLHTFTNAAGREHVAAANAIHLPAGVAEHVEMVVGVLTFPFPLKHHVHAVSPRNARVDPRFHTMQRGGSSGISYYGIITPRDLAAYYGYPDVTQSSRSGGNKITSVAVAQFDSADGRTITYESFSASDIASQGKFSDVPNIQTAPVTVGDYSASHTPQGEPSLDIQVVTANNPTTNAWFIEEDDTAWIYGLTLTLLSLDPPPQVVSISYGSTEDVCDGGCPDGLSSDSTVTYLSRTDTELMKLGLMGVSVIAASGDDGANGDGNVDCKYTGSEAPTYLFVSYPASSAYVTAVGATQISNPTGVTSETDTTWCGLSSSTIPSGYTVDGLTGSWELECITGGTEQAVSSGFASGGGFSRYFAQPSWQTAVVSDYLSSGISLPPSTYYNASGRAVPDVSIYGAGFPVIVDGAISAEEGTSLSSPLFAVVVSLLNQVSIAAGGSSLGFLNPLLYGMAASVSGTFKDITVGSNAFTESATTGCKGFTAASGWDPVTGLGSPVYTEMAAYVESLVGKAVSSSSSSSSPSFSSSSSSSSSSTFSSSSSSSSSFRSSSSSSSSSSAILSVSSSPSSSSSSSSSSPSSSLSPSSSWSSSSSTAAISVSSSLSSPTSSSSSSPSSLSLSPLPLQSSSSTSSSSAGPSSPSSLTTTSSAESSSNTPFSTLASSFISSSSPSVTVSGASSSSSTGSVGAPVPVSASNSATVANVVCLGSLLWGLLALTLSSLVL